MKGLELSRRFFDAYGMPMLKEEFPHLLPYLAAGFTGSGSERYGFDDAVSEDHDFEPGFCLFLPDEDTVSRRDAFLLERAYAKLPKEFLGYRRQPLSPVGGNRNGVFRTSEYYLAAVGAPDGVLSRDAWLRIPDYALAEAVNGVIFYDGYGEVTRIRASLAAMPEEIRRKRIAGNLLLMAQAGQYNYARCLAHGEPDAAQLACFTFSDAAMKVFFLLSGKYLPYYKWSFRALRELGGEDAETLAAQLSFLLSGNSGDPETAREKIRIIEDVARRFAARLRARKLTLTDTEGAELEALAYSVNDGIRDGDLRNMNIFAAT